MKKKMKKTNVKHHLRRTKKKVVPVRKHSRKLKKNRGMAVVPKTTVPIIDSPEDYNTVKKKVIVKMAPQEFFDTLQKKLKEKHPDRPDQSPEEFRESIGGLYESRVEKYMKDLDEGKEVPTGYILESEHKDRDGKIHKSVEFDVLSGVEAARRKGVKEIPVILAEGRKYTSTGFLQGDWDYSDSEFANKEDEENRYTIESVDSKDGIHRLREKLRKPGTDPNSIRDEDFYPDAKDRWREVTTIDMSKLDKDEIKKVLKGDDEKD